MKVYMVAPYEDYYGYDMACAHFFSTLEAAKRFCAMKNEKDNSWEVEDYEVDVD